VFAQLSLLLGIEPLLDHLGSDFKQLDQLVELLEGLEHEVQTEHIATTSQTVHQTYIIS